MQAENVELDFNLGDRLLFGDAEGGIPEIGETGNVLGSSGNNGAWNRMNLDDDEIF